MTTKIFPSVNDVNGGSTGDGKNITESNLSNLINVTAGKQSYKISGFGLSSSGLTLTVSAGTCVIDGYYVSADGDSVTIPASSTNRVWLTLSKDGSGFVTGAAYQVTNTSTFPSSSVLICEIVSDGSSVTSTDSNYAFSITTTGKSWTPELSDSSSSVTSAGQTYSVNTGRYVTSGNIIYATGQLDLTSLGTLSGNAYIHGLPGSLDYINGLVTKSAQLAITAGQSITINNTASGNKTLSLMLWDASTGSTNMQCSEISDNGILTFSATGIINE